MTTEQEVKKLKTELDRIKEKLSRIENVKQLLNFVIDHGQTTNYLG